MATEQLKVKITADANQAKAEISKFKNALKETASTGETATKSLGKVTVALGGMMIALKGVKAAVKNAVDVAAIGDTIKDNAQKVFMGTTAYQEWGYALKQNGVEMSALKVGMRQFAQQVASGSKNLAKYGITATDIDTAFQQAVFTIQNMSSETERVAAATELFGARALELMPVLNLTNAETQSLMQSYRLLGGTMSNELIAASDVCSDSILAMKTAWQGLKNVLAAYIIPVITKVVQWITVAIAYVRIFLRALFGIKETYGGKTGASKKSIAGASASTAKSTGGTAGNLKKAAKHAKDLRKTLMGIDELSRLAEKATAAAAGGGSGGGGGISTPAISGGDIGSFDGIISDETMSRIETFQEKIDKIKGILNGTFDIVHGLVKIALGDWAGGWDLIKQGVEKVWENLKKLFPSLENVEKAWKTLKDTVGTKALEAWVTIKDTFTGAWGKIKDAWNSIKDKTATVTTKLSDSFSKAWDKIKGKWNDVKSKTATITLKFTDKMKSLWNSLAKKVNAARKKGGLAKKLLPAMPTLARGGVLTAPTAAIMGEYAGARSNPEIATPQSLMYETMIKANGDMVAAQAAIGRQIIAAIENQNLTVKIGDETIAKSAQRGNSAYKSRTGKALLTV